MIVNTLCGTHAEIFRRGGLPDKDQAARLAGAAGESAGEFR